MTRAGVVIVGAGQAGVQASVSLRDLGCTESITLVNGEGRLPYRRPPLSKAYMLGKIEEEGLRFRHQPYYAQADIRFVGSDPAIAIDRAARRCASRRDERFPTITSSWPPGRAIGRSVSRAWNWAACFRCGRSRMPRGCAERLASSQHVGCHWRRIHRFGTCRGCRWTRRQTARDRRRRRGSWRGPSRPKSPPASRGGMRRAGTSFTFNDTVARIEGHAGRAVAVTTGGGRRAARGPRPHRRGRAAERRIGAGRRIACRQRDCGGRTAADRRPRDFRHRRLCCIRVSTPMVRSGSSPFRTRSIRRALLPRASWDSLLRMPRCPGSGATRAKTTLQIAGIAAAGDIRIVGGDEGGARFSVFRFRDGALACVESVNRVTDHMAARALFKSGRQARLTPGVAAVVSHFELGAARQRAVDLFVRSRTPAPTATVLASRARAIEMLTFGCAVAQAVAAHFREAVLDGRDLAEPHDLVAGALEDDVLELARRLDAADEADVLLVELTLHAPDRRVGVLRPQALTTSATETLYSRSFCACRSTESSRWSEPYTFTVETPSIAR